jgi:hypothetical protein
MIIEMRTYKTKPGYRAQFLEIFRSHSRNPGLKSETWATHSKKKSSIKGGSGKGSWKIC